MGFLSSTRLAQAYSHGNGGERGVKATTAIPQVLSEASACLLFADPISQKVTCPNSESKRGIDSVSLSKSQAKAARTRRGGGCNLSQGFWKSHEGGHVITKTSRWRKGNSEVKSFVWGVLAVCNEAGVLH